MDESAMEEGSVSARAHRWGNFKIELRDTFFDIDKNPYHEIDNPMGIINLCTAHNGAIADVVIEKLNQSSLKQWDASMLPYTPGRLGIPRLRSAIAEFLTQELATPEPLDPDKV